MDTEGNNIYFETIKSPFYNESGKIIGTMGIARNINERKKAEEALKASEEKYKHLVEELSDVVLTISPLGTLEYCSPTIENFGGYTPEEIIGTHIRKYFKKQAELTKTLKVIKEVVFNKTSASV